MHDHFQAYLPSSGIDIVGGANEWLIGDHIAFSSLYRITKEGETLNVYLANAVYCQLCIERAPLPPEAPPVPSPFSLDLRGSAIAPEVGTPTFVMINGKLLERFGVEHGPGLNTYIIKPSGSTRAFNSHNVYHTLTGVEQWNAWAEFIDNFSAPGDIIAVVSSESIYNAPLQGKATDLLKAVGATISFDAMRGIPPKRTAYALVFIRGKTTCYETVAWDGKNAEIQVKVDINAQTLTTVYLTPRTEPELESVSPVNQPASTDSSITQPSNNLYFDGRYNYIRCDLKEPDTGVTHELWFKTSHPGAGILSVTKGDIDNNQGYDRLIYLENGQLRAELAQMDIAQPQNRVVDVIQSSTGAPLADDAWHHVAHVFSGSEQKLYLDGQLIGSSAKRGTSMFSWHDALLIGYCFNASAPYFSGQISDVRVWNKARQQSEIQAGMSSRLRGNEPGLIGYWPLDGDVRNYADNPSVISAGFNAGELIGPEDWQPWRDNEVLKPLTESVLAPLSAPALTAAFTWFKDQAKTKDINTLIQTPSSFGYPLPPALRGLLANRLLSFGEASISNVVYEIVDGVPGEISVNPVDIEEPRPENKRLRVSGLVSYASRFGAMNARTEYLEVFQYRGKPGASIKFKLNEPVNLGAWLDGVSLLAGIPLKDVGLIISDPQVILSTMDVKDMEKEEGTVPVTPSEKEEEGREVNKGFNLFGKIDLKNSPNSIMRNVGTIVRTEKIDVHAAIKTESTPSEYVLSGEVEYDPPHVFNYRDQIEVFLKGTELTLSSVGQENSVEVGATAQVIINEERLALLKLPGMQLQKRTFDIVGGISFEPGQISGKFTAKPEQEWSNPFGVERVTIRKASAVLGYTGPALTSVGVAGDISLNNAPGVFETLVDLTNPQSIIFACKFDQLTLFDVMAVYYSKYYPLYEKLPGGLQNVLDRIVKKVSMQNVDILFAPEDGEIGEEKIEQGMAAKGDLDIWGWKSRLALKVDFDSGILDAGATLGSISLANIVKVEGISPQAGPQFKLHVEPSASNPMAAEISGRLTFMGWSSTDVIIRAAEDGLAFQLAADLLVDNVKVNLRFVYREDSSITADGALAVALNVDIPVGIGTLNLRAGLIAQLGIDATLNSYKAVVKGEFMFMDRKITFPELTLTNAPATASALVKEIEKQLISIAASLFADLFKTLTDLARALAEKLIELAFTLANIGVQVFHETVENIAQAYKDAKKIAGEAASEIKGVFTDLNPDQMADLLCGVAYSMDDVKNALVDTFKISPEEAFGKATAAAQKVLDSVLKGEIDAKKTADELAKEVEKRVPGASGKMIALGFRNAGVSANMVINVYGKVFGAFKDAMPAEIQAALEAVGYVRNEILGAFKTAGGALAKYAEDVWDTLNPTKW